MSRADGVVWYGYVAFPRPGPPGAYGTHIRVSPCIPGLTRMATDVTHRRGTEPLSPLTRCRPRYISGHTDDRRLSPRVTHRQVAESLSSLLNSVPEPVGINLMTHYSWKAPL